MAQTPTMKPAEEWTQAEAEAFAAVYASTHKDVSDQAAADERLRKALARYMELNDLTELVDGETGLGVEKGKPRRNTTWDVKSMPAALRNKLAARGLFTVITTAFDTLREKSGGIDLDDAMRWRIDGESAAPVQVRTPR